MTAEHLEYALFSRGEMERRYARARAMMAHREIDALLVSGEENFQYLAGTTASIALHYSLTRPSLFILPLERDPIIVTQGRANLALGSYVADLRDYTNILDFPHQLALQALQDAGLENKRIGAELGQEQRMGMPVGAYSSLVEALPAVEFVDCADILIGLRMVKSSEELAYMRQAAAITGRARQRLFDQVEPGMTERQVARLIRQLILEEGGDRTAYVILQLGLSRLRQPVSLRPSPRKRHGLGCGHRGLCRDVHYRLSPHGHLGAGHVRATARLPGRPARGRNDGGST